MEIISSRLLLILWTVPASATITTSMLDIPAVDSAITEDQTLVEGIIGVVEDTLIAVEGSIMEDATSVEGMEVVAEEIVAAAVSKSNLLPPIKTV